MNYSLENGIMMLYEYHYNVNISDYELGNIDIEKIEESDLETVDVGLLKELISGKFRLELYNEKESIIYLKRFSDSFPVLVKLSPLDKGINRDNFMSYVLSERVLRGDINLVLLPLFNMRVKYSDIESIMDVYKENEIIKEKISNGEMNEEFSVRIRENFSNMSMLKKYLIDKKVKLSELLFLLCVGLGQIYDIYENFRHNNLNMEAVYIRENKGIKEYIIGNESYSLLTEIEIRIGNFERSSMVPYLKNNDKILKNHYLDLYNFCKELKKSENYGNIIVDELGESILNEILIKKIYSNNNKDRIMENIEPITPKKLLVKHYKSSREIKNSYTSSRKLNSMKITGKLPSSLGEQDFNEPKLKRILRTKKSKEGGVRKLVGGASFQPTMKKDPNSPHLTNDQRLSYKKLQGDRPPIREPAVLAEQKVYQPVVKAPRPPNPSLYPPAFVPVNTPYSSVPIPMPYNYKPNQLPIQNIYNLNIADPRGDHSVLARVYEDLVPGDEFGLSSRTVDERIKSSNYITSIMLKKNEGDDVSLTGGKDSLLEHIQLHQLNPYHYTDPQKELSNGFLLYTSAYPIRYNAEKESIALARNSMGINMRIYRLSEEELRSHFSSYTTKLSHNVWRELYYYQRIKELIKNKKYSNFVKMHFWVLDRQSNIRWDKLETIKYNGRDLSKLLELINGRNMKIEEVNDIRKKLVDEYLSEYSEVIRNNIIEKIVKGLDEEGWKELDRLIPGKGLLDEDSLLRRTVNSLSGKLGEELITNSNTSLGIMTESPNHTFIRWATPIYEGSGSLRTMTSSGYHEPEVWISLLFQFIYGLSILQEECIYYNNFDFRYNLLVKDIYYDDKNTNHWRYNVNGLTFYVPNYGYIGMIDSYYNKQDNENIFKILTNEDDINIIRINTGKEGENKKELLRDLIYENMFKKLIDKSYYNGEFIKLGGLKPPREFYEILDRLNVITSRSIKDYLLEFRELLHNRSGSIIGNEEKKMVDFSRLPTELSNGSLAVFRDESDNQYKYVVIMSKEVSDLEFINKYKIWDGKNIRSVYSSQLFVSINRIEPEIRKGVKYDLESLLEEYNL